MKTTKTLAFMGLIPFVASFFISIQSLTWQIESKQTFIAYSAIILSFVAGTLWKKSEQKKYDKQKVISNVFSLVAFLALLVNHHLALVILAINYLNVFLFEVRLANLDNQGRIMTAYIKMRLQLTVIVILLHIAAFILW